MTEHKTQPPQTAPPRGPRPRGRFVIWLMMALAVMACVFLVAVMSLTGRVVILPDWMSARIESRLDAALAPADLTIGRTRVEFSRRGVPGVYFSDVSVMDGAGRPLAQLPEVSITLAGKALLEGRIELRRVALNGASIVLRRSASGQFDLAMGDTMRPVQAQSLGRALDQIDQAFAQPMLAGVETVTVEALHVSYTDARAGRFWQVRDGLMTLDQTDENLSAQLFFALRSDVGVPSEVAMSFETVKGSPESRISANFSDVPAADIATQSPALAFLGVLQAPISGAMRGGVAADGTLAPLNAALQIGAGALRPEADAAPIRFERGRAYFSYDPAQGRINLSEVSVKSDALSLTAEGHAYLKDHENGWPSSLTTQIRMRQVELTPKGVFAEPARFSSGAADFKLTLDPFSATIGQAVLSDENGADYRGSGKVSVSDAGWAVALDLALNQIEDQALLQLWPVDVVPNTREWVANNVNDGLIYDVRGALRLIPEAEPVASLTWEFRDASVRFLKTMPPVENGFGYSSISDNAFTMVLESGSVTAPSGGQVDPAGTVVRVPDIRQRPAVGHITLRTDSSIEAMLSLLDLPPLNVMSRAGQPVTLAKGRARVEVDLRLPLLKKVQTKDVTYDMRGTLTGVRSETLVKGRVLTASQLELHADNQVLTIGGQAALDGVPVQGSWTQKMGPEHRGISQVDGVVMLSQQASDAFRLGLPPGSLSGQAEGRVTLSMTKGQPPEFTLSSDLERLGISLAGVGWTKPPAEKGTLEVAGQLSQPAVINRFDLSAAGMTASEGRAVMHADGSLDRLSFGRVLMGGWLDAPVSLVGRGAGVPPEIQVTGGALDLRASPMLKGGGGGAGGQSPIRLALDQLTVSRSIELLGVEGVLEPGGGLQGKLSAVLRGGGPVAITLAPTKRGTAIRVRSNDAGGVLRGAGIFEKSTGGSMDLLLAPLGKPGHYDGQIRIERTRVQGAPALAELLSAVSVVGLLDGEGLVFTTVDGRFRLTPAGLEVKRSSAVGPSLGISMAGVMDFGTGKMHMQGVISPVYMINGIGQIFSRRGEGLFGFNYALRGDAKAPEVKVNPLSILTPGMFREIFRSAPPELPE
ncbi:DUF3971 domain-containing protein [Actibacterium sp. XHP0104]|uniref:YhdP family protein n=1 Tax=Actibacterium sp. XHP0104 TaxID=2984335 RepID=UPI0021E8F4F7|nr:DUF3971 domain-containing protein [Actibacterium sp. XHP0104]MCV2880821.1 DUF3971 domain-containing protein [Actibacterium sp. XHP0104]